MSDSGNLSSGFDFRSQAKTQLSAIHGPIPAYSLPPRQQSLHDRQQASVLPPWLTTPICRIERDIEATLRLVPEVKSGSGTLYQQAGVPAEEQYSSSFVRDFRENHVELSPDRPSSAAGRAHAHSTPTKPPRLLRASTSIPDYKAINTAYTFAAATAGTPKSKSALQNDASQQLIISQEDGLNPARERFPSALTSASSATEHSNAAQSASWTDHSSVSDASTPPIVWPRADGDEMSVEDAIAMYSDGFEDDSPSVTETGRITKPLIPSSLAQIPETKNTAHPDHFVGFLPPQATSKAPRRALASISTAPSKARATAQLSVNPEDGLPDLQNRLKALIAPARDRYGFKKESLHVKTRQYDAWNTGYIKYLEKRRKKWESLLKQHNLPTENPERFPPKSDKVKRYVRKGLPPEWRGAAWFFYAGGPARLANNIGLYERLVAMAARGRVAHTDQDHIERDLYRTFPDHIKFKSDGVPARPGSSSARPDGQIETPMIASLRRVLQAFAIHNPRIGYCQSLNFLAGFLLLFLDGSEEKTFHLLCILTSQHLPGTHGISLEGANIDVNVLMMCLKEAMPALWGDKLDDRADTTVSLAAGDMRVSTGLPTVSLATTGWFMSCFTATLPIETTCRVWDCLFYEGSKTLFRVGLAIFKLSEREIRRTGDEPMEVFQVVQTLPKSFLDANLVMDTATKKTSTWTFGPSSSFGNLSQKTIENRRGERRKMYKQERERVLMKALTMPVTQDNVLEEKFKKAKDLDRLKRFVSEKSK